jgi:hypothetical protein
MGRKAICRVVERSKRECQMGAAQCSVPISFTPSSGEALQLEIVPKYKSSWSSLLIMSHMVTLVMEVLNTTW